MGGRGVGGAVLVKLLFGALSQGCARVGLGDPTNGICGCFVSSLTVVSGGKVGVRCGTFLKGCLVTPTGCVRTRRESGKGDTDVSSGGASSWSAVEGSREFPDGECFVFPLGAGGEFDRRQSGTVRVRGGWHRVCASILSAAHA